MRFVVTARGAPLWEEAADLVLRRFSEAFEATRRPDPDWFVAAQDEETGQVLACVSVTFAAGKRFFAEYYLPDAAERVIAERTGKPVDRAEVIELGSIASAGKRAASEIITVLPVFAEDHGYKYGLFTANADLASALERVGFPFEPLADARIDALPEEYRSGWGSYYDHRPVTGVIRLEKIKEMFGGNTADSQVVPIKRPVFHYDEVESSRALA